MNQLFKETLDAKRTSVAQLPRDNIETKDVGDILLDNVVKYFETDNGKSLMVKEIKRNSSRDFRVLEILKNDTPREVYHVLPVTHQQILEKLKRNPNKYRRDFLDDNSLVTIYLKHVKKSFIPGGNDSTIGIAIAIDLFTLGTLRESRDDIEVWASFEEKSRCVIC